MQHRPWGLPIDKLAQDIERAAPRARLSGPIYPDETPNADSVATYTVYKGQCCGRYGMNQVIQVGKRGEI